MLHEPDSDTQIIWFSQRFDFVVSALLPTACVCVCVCVRVYVCVLLAYIRADEFKMFCVCACVRVCVCVRAIAAQRQTSCEQLLYGNECRPSFAPSRICIAGFSFSVRARRFLHRSVCLSLCASYPFCFTDSRVKRFSFSSPPKNSFDGDFSFFLFVFFNDESCLIYLQMRSPALTSTCKTTGLFVCVRACVCVFT